MTTTDWNNKQMKLRDVQICSLLKSVVVYLLALKYIFDPALWGRLKEIFLMFRELAEAETALEYLRTALCYTLPS